MGYKSQKRLFGCPHGVVSPDLGRLEDLSHDITSVPVLKEDNLPPYIQSTCFLINCLFALRDVCILTRLFRASQEAGFAEQESAAQRRCGIPRNNAQAQLLWQETALDPKLNYSQRAGQQLTAAGRKPPEDGLPS